jgi:flagellar biosynthesis protein FlhA
VLKANMADLLSYAEVQKLLKELPKEAGRTVQGHRAEPDLDVRHPARVATLAFAERISIRDLGTILEGIAEAVPHSRNAAQIVEQVRVRLCPPDLRATHLAERLSAAHFAFAEMGTDLCGIDRRHRRRKIARHAALEAFGIRDRGARALRTGRALNEAPVLLTSAAARPFVRQIVDRFRRRPRSCRRPKSTRACG